MTETQQTISDWVQQTFGSGGTNQRCAVRANKEMSELLTKLSIDDNHPDAAEEIADVVIILTRLATRLGVNLQAEIDRKMNINRLREWRIDADGIGQHIER